LNFLIARREGSVTRAVPRRIGSTVWVREEVSDEKRREDEGGAYGELRGGGVNEDLLFLERYNDGRGGEKVGEHRGS
jgi:hypothetical protein